MVRKLYGCGSWQDVWPLDVPKKPGNNCTFQTIFNIYGTLPIYQYKHTQTNNKEFHQHLPNIQQIPSECQESTVVTCQQNTTPTIVINYMIIHTPASAVL
jgi:hypothetical protein